MLYARKNENMDFRYYIFAFKNEKNSSIASLKFNRD